MKPWTACCASIGALTSLQACRPKAEAPEAELARAQSQQQETERAIAARFASFVVQYNSGHADSAAAFFTEDAHLLAPNLPALAGRAAIQAAFTEGFSSKPTLTLNSESVTAAGDMAIERGTYEESYTMSGAKAALTDRGKYLTHWHRIGGQWLIVDEIANSDLPAFPVPGTKP